MKSGLFSTFATLFGGFEPLKYLYSSLFLVRKSPSFKRKKIALNTRESDFFAS